MSKKRKRNGLDVDLGLMQIYNQLADENGETRIAAAQQLLSKVFPLDESNIDQTKAILARLFRGLCSSRKAARLGFSVALTEALAVIRLAAPSEEQKSITPSSVIDLLQQQTTVEGNPTGQEERDHYIGRIFGAEAIIKSAILFPQEYSSEWKRLVDIICGVAVRKTWLRRECGWIFYATVTGNGRKSVDAQHALVIIEKLSASKLIRTPEGLAVWLGVRQSFPELKLPNQLWKYDHPLAKKDVNGLADLLKDARAQSTEDDDGYEVQGAAQWSPQLHFAWVLVLQAIVTKETSKRKKNSNSGKDTTQPELINFKTFWSKVVEKNFFAASASTERKHVGFLVWTKVLSDFPPVLLSSTFSPNTVHWLTQELKGQDRYLTKAARKLTAVWIARLNEFQDAVGTLVTQDCLAAILSAVNFENFDRLSNSKTVQKLLETNNLQVQNGLQNGFLEAFRTLRQSGPAASEVLKGVVEMQARVFSAILQNLKRDKNKRHDGMPRVPFSNTLQGWVEIGYFNLQDHPVFPDDVRMFIRQKLASTFEQCLNYGMAGTDLVISALREIHRLGKSADTFQLVPQFDDNISRTIDKGWDKFLLLLDHAKRLKWMTNRQTHEIRSSSDFNHIVQNGSPDRVHAVSDKREAFVNGLKMLYVLVLFETYNGEPDAVEILEELINRKDLDLGTVLESTSAGAGTMKDVDSLVEILLSFASKPSRFMRKATTQIFETLVSELTLKGLDPLLQVLAAKENAKGQDDMFEQEVQAGSNDDSDVEMIGSDVEVTSQSESEDDSESPRGDSSHGSEEDVENGSADGAEESGSDSDVGGVEDEELAAFDAALAAALGTRKGQDDLQADDTSGSSSDEDMNDDEMMAVDEKLAEVFRARSQQTNKKKEQKEAKGNVVNFKNRVLDMIEIYLKSQHLNILSIELTLPLLRLIRKTSTKQLADKACTILRDYTSRCKGQNIPAIQDSEHDLSRLLGYLEHVHQEVCRESSNAHSKACTQCSLLLVKTFVHGGGDFKDVVDIYGDTRVRQVTDPTCKIQPAFFTEWNNWCVSARVSLSK